jgi:hypothetical protein
VTVILKRRKGSTAMHRAVVLVAQAANIPFYSHSLPQVVPEELARARRYQRVLTLAILGRWKNSANSDSSGGRSSELGLDGPAFFSYPLIGSMVRAAIRESDTVIYDASNDRYLLLLPEATKEEAHKCLLRIHQLVRERTTIELREGTAEYPTDALTVEDLIIRSEQGLNAHLQEHTAGSHLRKDAYSAFLPMRPAGPNTTSHRKVI